MAQDDNLIIKDPILISDCGYGRRVKMFMEPDFPLTSYLQMFEAHMFSTTGRMQLKQEKFPDYVLPVYDGREGKKFHFDDVNSRSGAMQYLNKSLKAHLGHNPTKDDVGNFLVVWNTIDGLFKEKLDIPVIIIDYQKIIPIIREFSFKNDRVVAVTPHFFQNDRWPHLHVMYERKPGEDNAMQEFILEHWR